MTRIVKVEIPAKVVFRLDEYDLDDLGVMGKDVWLRRSRDGRTYASYPFAEDDPRAEEVLDYLRDACGSAMRLVDVTAQYTFETTAAPNFLDFPSTVAMRVEEDGRTRQVAVLRRVLDRQLMRYAHAEEQTT